MEYLLKASAITTLFYLCYKVFLQRETFFESNRWFLLIGLLATIFLPLLVIPIYIKNPNAVLNLSDLLKNVNVTNTSTKINYSFIVLSTVYIVGASFFFFKLILEFVSLFRLIKKNKSIKKGGYTYIVTEHNTSPFSFFNFIVYNPKQFNTDELRHIINHEKIHVKHWHSVDTLLIQFATIFFWFNPFVWFYKKELQQNLEFIADKNAQSISSCKKSYEYVLLKTTINKHQLILTNNFYTSLIKKRIIMLHKSKSNKLNALKYAFVLPLLAIFLMSFNTKEVYLNDNQSSIIHTLENNKIAIINKDFTDAELEITTAEFKNIGVTLNFKGVKRNSKNEIIAIKVVASSKKSNANLSISSDEAIKSIKITYNNEDDSISIGSIESKKIFITNDGTHKIVKSESDSNVFILTEDEEGKDHNIKVIIKDKNGNSKDSNTFVKREVIHLDSDDSEGHGKVVYITKDKDGKTIKEEIIKGSKNLTWVVEEDETKKEDGNIFISTDGNNSSPLIFIDNKESTKAAMEELSPDDIATVNVLKGKTAINKYGERATNGVIMITTKK